MSASSLGTTPPAARRGVPRARRRAFTLVELLLGLVVMALVAGVSATVVFAVVQATEVRNDLRKTVLRSHLLDIRLREEINRSASFLAVSGGKLVLWSDDRNDDQGIQLDELVLLEWDSGTNTLRRYAIDWPDGWSQAQIDAANTSYNASSDFLVVVEAAKATMMFPGRVWSTVLSAWTVVLDHGTAQLAKLATIRGTITMDGVDRAVVVAASIRTPVLPGAGGS